jgi:hypothetical protein
VNRKPVIKNDYVSIDDHEFMDHLDEERYGFNLMMDQ